jgi:metal-responsive CopG/Arc/MetJ family transcriptional regulator
MVRKISISVLEDELDKIDNFCKKERMSRSALFVKATLSYINKDIKLGEYKESDFSSRKAMANEIEKDAVRVMENKGLVDAKDRVPGKNYTYIPYAGKYKES